jgi:hypothetical protein
MKLHVNRAEERRNIAKGLGRGRHKTYHPKTHDLEKRSNKMQFNINAAIACKNCNNVFSRRIDTLTHFEELAKKNRWGNDITFIKPEDAKDVFEGMPNLKDIAGGWLCPKCYSEYPKNIENFWAEYKEKKAALKMNSK